MEQLEAEQVYVLMKNDYHISRNFRAQWYFNHLNEDITVQKRERQDEFHEELEVVSAEPRDPPSDWDSDTSHLYKYKITPATGVIFLAHEYRLTFVLDLSASSASIDTQRTGVLIENVFAALKKCLEGLVRPFFVPGSEVLFNPQLSVTVVAYTPFTALENQQVFASGCALDQKTLPQVLVNLGNQLIQLEDHMRRVAFLGESERVEQTLNNSDVPPDATLINLLRVGNLALNLMPENSTSGLIIITDGLLGVSRMESFEGLLTAMRNNTIVCHIVQLSRELSSSFLPGCLPDTDLLRFIARATLGAYLSHFPEVENDFQHDMNIYHKSFLGWSFQKGLREYSVERELQGDVCSNNPAFLLVSDARLTKELLTTKKLNTHLTSILSCRLREGYTIREVQLEHNELSVCLVLPWRTTVNLIYTVTSVWPPSMDSGVYCEVAIEGEYEFVQDVASVRTQKIIPFRYRKDAARRFWAMVRGISETDKLLVHLHSFHSSPTFYTLSDSMRNGLPLFCFDPKSSQPVLWNKDVGHPQLVAFWKPMCMLDVKIWQKWFHTHRISVVLTHDRLPQYVHLPEAGERYPSVTARSAAIALHGLLREHTTFMLIEDHSYIKMHFSDGDTSPSWFYIIRLTWKPPCVIIRLAFLGGTPGNMRNEAICNLREKLLQLQFTGRTPVKEQDYPQDASHCAWIYNKPLEKILIHYKRMPSEYKYPVTSCFLESVCDGGVQWTLARYLQHLRTIWSSQSCTQATIPPRALARILMTIIRIRLREGFHFVHSSQGIIYMILELKMRSKGMKQRGGVQKENCSPCLLQYILFPPQNASASAHGSQSVDGSVEDADAEDSTEADGEVQLITETWVEPQGGVSVSLPDAPPHQRYLHNLEYQQLAHMVWQRDLETLSTLLTLEHLSLMCQNKGIPSPVVTGCPTPARTKGSKEEFGHNGIHLVPFCFDLFALILKCQQTELLFSTFLQEFNESDLITVEEEKDTANKRLLEAIQHHIEVCSTRELILSPSDQIKFTTYLAERYHPAYLYNSQVEESGAKWRCFIKAVSITHVMLTLIPASFSDLKKLVLSAAVLNGQPNQGFHVVHQDEDIVRKSNYSSLSTSLNSLMEISRTYSYDKSDDMGRSVFVSRRARAKSGGSSMELGSHHQRRRKSSFEQVMRSRAGSLDVYYRHQLRRTSSHHEKWQDDCMDHFTSSTESMLPATLLPESTKFWKRAVPVPSSRDERLDSMDYSDASSTPHKEKLKHRDVLGWLTLPVYIYDCSVSEMIQLLIEGEAHSSKKDIRQDFTFSEEDCGDDIITLKPDAACEPTAEDKDAADSEEGKDLSPVYQQVYMLNQTHTRCWGSVVFHALQLGLVVHASDITRAIQICQASVFDINLTSFIKAVCGHIKDFKAKSLLGNWKSRKEGSTESFPLSTLHSHHPNKELVRLQAQVKNKFNHILRLVFRPVPTDPHTYYYCHPDFNRGDLGLEAEIDHYQDDDKETTTNASEIIEFAVDSDAIRGENGAGETSFQQGSERVSMISVIDSDSLGAQDFIADLDLGDSDPSMPPLFIQLGCSVSSKGRTGNCSVTSLPTCLGEVSSPIEKQDVQNIDLNDFVVSLDVHCLTLPPNLGDDLFDDQLGLRATSFSSSSPVPNQSYLSVDDDDTISSGPEISEVEVNPINHLPEYQEMDFLNTMKEIKCLLQDEIISSLLHTFPITEAILNQVVEHVQASPDRGYCRCQRIPLEFVVQSSDTMARMLKHFQDIKVGNYVMEKERSYFYLVEEQTSLHIDTWLEQSWIIPQTSPHSEVKHHMASEEGATNKLSPSLEEDELAESNASSLYHNRDTSGHESYESGENVPHCFEENWKMDQELYKPKLPKFWYIFKVEDDCVNTYYHCRYTDADEIDAWRVIRSTIERSIRGICRLVNQRLLLEDLNMSRICNVLLEADKPSDSRRESHDISEYNHLEREQSLQEKKKFHPGSFACDVVWETRFHLHSRLKVNTAKGYSRQGQGGGLQALHSIFNQFSVSNRKNMFVYQDSETGSIFYFRLSESRKAASDSEVEQNVEAFEQAKVHENDALDNQSIYSEDAVEPPNLQEDFILLTVHGITEPGVNIITGLVGHLQKRLDEAVLKVLGFALRRNPLCKLTCEDVHFLQPPKVPALRRLRYCLPTWALEHFNAVLFYLRQILLLFLHLPKYAESLPQHHFQDLDKNGRLTRSVVPEGDAFIYNQFQTLLRKDFADNQFQTLGRKEFAVVILSPIDENGKPITAESTHPNPCSYLQPLQPFEYEAITTVTEASDNTRSEVVLEFRFWEHGNVDFSSLAKKIKSSIRQALWDLAIEYKLLTAPLPEPEPISPLYDSRYSPDGGKMFRDSRSASKYSTSSCDDKQKGKEKPPEKKHRATVVGTPILSTKSRGSTSPQPSRHSEEGPRSIDLEVLLDSPTSLNQTECEDNAELEHVFSTTLSLWLPFAKNLEVPSVKHYVLNLPARYSVKIFLKEFLLIVHGLTGEVGLRYFYKNEDGQYFPYNITWTSSYTQEEWEKEQEGGEVGKDKFDRSYIFVGRNHNLWRASTDPAFAHSLVTSKGYRTFLKFPPYIEDERFRESSPSSNKGKVFIPRQHLLFGTVDKNKVEVWLYNWARDNTETIIRRCRLLRDWLLSRSLLLNRAMINKLGYLPFSFPLESEQGMACLDPRQLIRHHSPFGHIPKKCKRDDGNLEELVQVYHNKKPALPMNKSLHRFYRDPVQQHGYQMLEMIEQDRKESEFLSLRVCNIDGYTLKEWMKKARMVHHVYTPILFLRSWRDQVLQIRTYALHEFNARKQRHGSGSKDSKRSEDNRWHDALYTDFLRDFIDYLHQLQGFLILHIGLQKSDKNCKEVIWMQKMLIRGSLLAEIGLSEPYFFIKLYVVEDSRPQLHYQTQKTPFVTNLVDEIDKFRGGFHLHSYMYDYHVKAAYSYVSSQRLLFKSHYHVISFLTDFIRYYPHSPNYSRNIAQKGNLKVSRVNAASQLYDYLLKNNHLYNLKVLRMAPIMSDHENAESEYVLIWTGDKKITFRDSIGTGHQQDFDMAVLICKDPDSDTFGDTVLPCQFFLLLSNKSSRQLFSKVTPEKIDKLSRFRTLSVNLPLGSKFNISCSSERQDDLFSTNNNATERDIANIKPATVTVTSLADAWKTENERYEKVTSCGFVSNYEELMQIILDRGMEEAKSLMTSIMTKATMHFRRDTLWDMLYQPRATANMKYAEFLDLLNMTKCEERLTNMDPSLYVVENMSVGLFHGAIKVLLNKYGEGTTRVFTSSSGEQQHFVILNLITVDNFVKFSLDSALNSVTVSVVFKEENYLKIGSSDIVCKIEATHALVKGVIEACLFHLWAITL